MAYRLPTLVVTHQLQVERRTGKVRRPETDVLPLCHATNVECGTNHTITRINIQTAGLALDGTGLCSYCVRGVDGSCAKHLTVESYTVIYAASSHTYYY